MLAETERTALTNSLLFSRTIGVAMVTRDGGRRRYWSVKIETSYSSIKLSDAVITL